jgi:hypothetical protein
MTRTLPREGIVTDRRAYLEHVRPGLRARLIPLRAARRVRLGDAVSCEFENADTLLYQVQEMVIVEGVQADADVLRELEAYGRLLPTSTSLSCTFFVEADDVATVRAELERLTGIQHGVSLRLLPAGDEPVVVPGVEVPGLDEDGPSTVTHAVHFLRFDFGERGRDLFRDPAVPAVLAVAHPEYAAQTPLAGDLRLALLRDLSLDR